VFFYADEFNLSWLPGLRAIWGPVGQQVMIPTPKQADKYYGIGAVNYSTGETIVQFHQHKRRKEMALLLSALLERHPTGTIYVVWDNANTHSKEDVQTVLEAAAGRIILLYLPTYSPWLNPIEMLWRFFRLQVTHCELFATKQALLDAARDFFDRYNRYPAKLLSVIGNHSANVA
jgi:transposase